MGSALFLILRIVCYVALAIVSSSLAALVLALTLGSCTQGTGWSTTCGSSFVQTVVDASYGALLITVFTGFPALLALGGIFFLLRTIFLRNAAPSAAADAGGEEARDAAITAPETTAVAGNPVASQPTRRSFGKFILKIVLIVLGGLFLLGVVMGVVGGES